MLEKTSLSETWRMVAAAEAGEIQSNKTAKTRKLKSSEPQTNYQITFAKAGENLSLLQL